MGIFNRRETPADDRARTMRLLDGVDAAYAARTGDPVDGGPVDDFESVILSATGAETTDLYPPPGHGYPRR